MHGAILVHGHFRKTNFGPSTEGLDTSVSLYTFCPMDTSAPSYTATVEEVNCLQQELFIGSRASTTAGIVGRVNQARTVRCLISPLVYMSAAIKNLAEFTDDSHPVLCTALEYMAKVLSSQTLQEKACSMISMSHFRTHFILNIIQGNIGAFFELAMGSVAKRLSSQGTIPLTLYQPALVRLQGFQLKVLEVFQQDLTTSLKPITYTAELAAVRRPVAPRRAPTAAAAPRAKSLNNKSRLSDAEYAKAKSSGFLRSCTDTTLSNTWKLLVDGWNIPNQCCYYSIQGFYCVT